MEEKKTIVVPWDFTEVSEYAYQHAVKIASLNNCKITLLHIINEKEKDPSTTAAEKELASVAEELNKKYSIKPSTIVKIGSIYTTIGATATELQADFVIMGTHGFTGMQKFTGSRTLKVIVSTHVPFIIVQSPPAKTTFENIVIPTSYRSETKEGINLLNTHVHYFADATFHMFKAVRTDKKLANKINSNVIYGKKFFMMHEIAHEVAEEDSSDNDVELKAVEYAANIKADLILIMATRDISFSDYLLGAVEQKVLANKSGIPVMCANPKPFSSGASFSTSGG